MGASPPNPPMFPQAPVGHLRAPQTGALYPNQSYGLCPQGAGTMPQQPQWPAMGYPSQPGQPMPGYPGAPSPNQPMPGFGGAPAPAPTPAYPSPNPSMPAYGGGAMPVNPPVNVRDSICLLLCLSVNMLLL